MVRSSPIRAVFAFIAVCAVGALGGAHLAFATANFQPGFPKLEGVAAFIAGAALFASTIMARRSLHLGFLTALFGTLPLVAWFAYAVPVQGSSDPHFFWLSLIVPTAAGVGALATRRRGKSA